MSLHRQTQPVPEQLSLVNEEAEPTSPRPARCKTPGRQAVKQPSSRSLVAIAAPPPAHQVTRGDLFRELFESDRVASTVLEPDMRTPEMERGYVYGTWADKWRWDLSGRRKLKGPIERLRRQVGFNRRADFDCWLRRIPGVTGSSLATRYRSLLSILESELRELSLDYQYTDRWYDTHDPTADVRECLERARKDVSEIPGLLGALQSVCYQLRYTKRDAVCKPLAPLPTSPSGRSTEAARNDPK